MEGSSATEKSSQLPSSSFPAQTGQTDITKIPDAVLEHIFTFLDQYSAQEAAQVDKLWNVSVITAIKNEESNFLNNLFTIILENIDENKYQNQYAEIKSIIKNNTVFDSISLLQIKNSLITTREALISQLIHLSKEDLQELQKAIQSSQSPPPRYFESMIDLAYLDKVSIEGDSDAEEKALIDLAKSLYDKGQLGYDRLKRIKENDRYEERFHLHKVIEYVAMDLINKDKYEQAALVGTLGVTTTLTEIVIKLAKDGKSDKAINLTKHVEDLSYKSMFGDIITGFLINNKDFDTCSKLINTLYENDERTRREYFFILAFRLLSVPDIDRVKAAEKIINTHSFSLDEKQNEYRKSEFLKLIETLRTIT